MGGAAGNQPAAPFGVLIAALVVAIVALGAGASRAVAASATNGSARIPTVSVRLTDAGCNPDLSAPAGPVRILVKNVNAEKVTEFEVLSGTNILGEVEDIAIGRQSEVVITLEPGQYTTLCPGGTRTSTGVLTVTAAGTATSSTCGAMSKARPRTTRKRHCREGRLVVRR